MIQPTPGRVVWYYPSARDLTGGNDAPMTVNGHDPLMAQVVAVHNARCVSLAVFDAGARKYARLRVQLLQEDGHDTRVDFDEPHCVWMPYQKTQAERNQRVELESAPEKSMADRLRGLIAIQSSPGTIDQGGYMHGMANGLILALSVVTGEDPKFIEITDFKQRVEIEKRELDDKIRKLEPFLSSTKFRELPEAEQNRLMQQRHCMVQYVTILNERIAAF